jgi:hypothetical protein
VEMGRRKDLNPPRLSHKFKMSSRVETGLAALRM